MVGTSVEEVERNLPKVGLTPGKATHRVGVMRREFPDALVTGYEPLVEAMTNDAKDRHVLAAAVRAGAEIVVTANLQDFPKAACVPYDIGVVHPDDFLLDQLDLYQRETLRCLREMVADRHTRTPRCRPSCNSSARRCPASWTPCHRFCSEI